MVEITTEHKGVLVSGAWVEKPTKCYKCNAPAKFMEQFGQYELIGYCQSHGEQVQAERDERKYLLTMLSSFERDSLWKLECTLGALGNVYGSIEYAEDRKSLGLTNERLRVQELIDKIFQVARERASTI